MKPRLGFRPVLLFLLWTSAAVFPSARAHDLMASHAKVRLKPETVEVEIKIAADSAWSLVQDSVVPSVAFVLEDFDRVGRPMLLAFARQMGELISDGRAVPARKIDVTVAEDNFIFSFTYPRPSGKAVTLKPNYLRSMPEGYTFLAMLLDENDEPISSAVLHRSETTPELAVLPRPKPSR